MAQSAKLVDDSGGEFDAKLQRNFGWLPYRLLAGAALAGCLIALLCDFVMWFLVSGYSPVAQTISELGAGPYQSVQDAGITAFALGTTALGTGLVLRGHGSTIAVAVRGAIYLLGIVVATIALYNEYGDGDVGGLEIHRYLVWAVYALVPFILFFACRAAPFENKSTERACRFTAIGWIVLAPFFKLVPDGWDGLYERCLALVMVGAVAIAACQLFRRPSQDG
jgi:hypothetical protein